MHIAHLITRLELGGAQRNTLLSCAAQAAAGHAVTLLAGAGGMLDGEAAALPGVTFIPLPELVHPLNLPADWRALRALTARLRALRPELVHTHSSKAGILGREAAAAAGVPLAVHTVHGWSFNDAQPAWRRELYVMLERRAARVTRALICVSAADRAAGLARGIGTAGCYRIIRSGIDWAAPRAAIARRAATRAALGVPDGQALVLMTACLKPQKNPLAFVALARAMPDALFLLAGDGDLRPQVERAAAGLGDRFRLPGWRQDIPDLVAAADALVLTSRWEGLPRAAVEAVAAGTPAVVTDTGGVRDIIDGDNGALVPVDDGAALAARLRAVLDWPRDPAARQARADAAQAKYAGEFALPAMHARLLALYAELRS
ncbi:MAG TPA: glycosyltransferase [bacterium]|nr:glycosyltransferase [bacterium]